MLEMEGALALIGMIPSFYRWGNEGSERLRELQNVRLLPTELVADYF